MKKMLTLALVALGITAAQAVNFGWDAFTGTGFGLAGKYTPKAGGSATLKIAVVCPMDENSNYINPNFESSSGKSIFSLAGISIVANGGHHAKIHLGDNVYTTGGHTSNDRLKEGTTIYTFNLTNYDSATQTWNVTASVAWSNKTNTTTTENFLNAGYNAKLSYDALASTTAYSSDLGFTGGMVDDKFYASLSGDFDTVPEPTVLALLALGVAGLALKRKVA